MAWPRSAVCDQFICATGVSALALASQEKKKHWHAEQRATQKKATPWEVGSSMGAVERLASLGSIALWFFLGTASWPLFFSCFSLGSSGTATDVFITIVSFSLSALALSVGEVHIRRDGITDYFPSSLLLARGRKIVALPSITFFFLLIFSYVGFAK